MSIVVKFNPLLCSPSPRDIPEVYEAHRKLPYDKLYAKYFIEREAYWHLRNFFLMHEEYSHMIICPDDLVIQPEDFELLKADILQDDYPILSGLCNVDLDIYRGFLSATQNLPHPKRPLIARDEPDYKKRWGWRWYAWFSKDTIKQEQERQGREIIQVMHSGFAMQALRRDVVKAIEFTTDAAENGITEAETSSVDVMFSNSCAMM